MHSLFALMSSQHGVASSAQVRAAGISRRVERRLLRDGVVERPCPGVLSARGQPLTFHGRSMAAAMSRGVRAISHGAAARLHELDGFDAHDTVDVLSTRGGNPHPALGVTVHRTRGDIDAHVTDVAGIPTLTIAATLALLAPTAGIARTSRALDAALRRGIRPDELRTVATAWRQRGRAGPPALLMLLGERVEHRLPRAWFDRVAAAVVTRTGVTLARDRPVRDGRGMLLATLELADPERRVGLESQHWQWHTTPAARERDAQRRDALRQLGWEVVDIWWSDLHRTDRVIAELTYLLRSRTVPARIDRARAGRP